jgi:hypothetical protein
MATTKSERPQRLAFAGERVFRGLDVSRRGDQLAYAVWRGNTNIWRVELGEPGTGAKEGVKFIASSHSDAEPAYSPENEMLSGKKLSRTNRWAGFICMTPSSIVLGSKMSNSTMTDPPYPFRPYSGTTFDLR